MPIGKISLRSMPCQRKATQELFKHRVTFPESIPMRLFEVLVIAETNGPLQGKAKVMLEQTLPTEFPLSIEGKNVRLDLETHRQKETMVNFPIIKGDLLAELEAESDNLYQGKRLYHNLLVIAELSPDFIKIEQNPNYSAFPQNEFLSTAQNLQKGIRTLTHGTPDDAIKEIVEGNAKGDLNAILKILAQDHPNQVKNAILNNKFEPILVRQKEKCLQKILYLLSSGALKLEKIFESENTRDLFPFLPRETARKIAQYLASKGKVLLKDEDCRQLDKWFGEMNQSEKEKIQTILSESRTEILKILTAARSHIEKTLGTNLEDLCLGKKAPVDESKLREAILVPCQNNLLEILLPGYIDEIANAISEARRSTLIEQVRKSNLIDNVKLPLLHALAEKEEIDFSQFSFTVPIFAAALLSTWLRGAEIKGLLDAKESRQSSSQYKDLINWAQILSERFSNLPAFEIRTFSGVQHQKNMLFRSSGVVVMGSQNLSERGFTGNLEDLVIIQNDQNAQIKKKEFDELFSISGSFVPFPEEILSRHWINRAGLRGIRFLDKVPSPSEASDALKLFSSLRIADFKKARNILEIAKGKRFELEVDLERSFQPFMAEIKNPMIAHFLTRFLEQVPLEFSFAAASSSGRLHPGTTSGLSGLIEHEYIAAEIAIKICKILGREDLIDQALLAILVHDTYKNAWETPQGTLNWGRYNPGHGQLAAKKADELYNDLHPREKNALKDIIPDVNQATGEHMSIFNHPDPTPLLPQDPILKWIVVMADMLASRKYIYVKHRARLPLEMDEILHLLLNNSFSIEGEALDSLNKDLELFYFIAQSTRKAGHPIRIYSHLLRRTKKMLRVAESLCDLFDSSKEVVINKKKKLNREDKKRIKTRNEILSTALLYATLRYKHGIREPNSKRDFDKLMRKLCEKYSDPTSRQRRILDLMLKVDNKLASPYQADLLPKNDPALWILCMANCMMTAEDVLIVTVDEVEQHLSKAEESKTIWDNLEKKKTKKFGPEVKAELFSGLKSLAFKEYLDELLPMIEEGLLTRLNFRRKNPLKKIHRDVLLALISKYDCLFPSYIYDQFYRQLSSHFRKITVEKIRKASESEEARKELIGEIQNQPDPAEESPTRIFRMGAQTALANGIRSIKDLKDATEAARDLESISDYSYFKQMNTAVEHVFSKIADPNEKILIYGDYDVDGLTATAILVKTLRWIKAKKLSQIMDRKEARKIAQETIGYKIPHRLNEGYGLNPDAIERIHQQGFKTIITADCAIKDRELIKQAKQMGIDTIVTDHHEPGEKDLPEDAVAILNPKLDLDPDHSAYYLPGAAVAYKLARALADRVGINFKDSFLDSVGLAAVADVVPMVGENRAFARAGLKRLNSHKKNKGLAAIINAFRLEKIDEEAMAYFLSPILNVVGRFGKAEEGLELLMTRTVKEARRRVSKMFSYLEARREIEQAIFDEAEKYLEEIKFDPEMDAGIAVSGEWHKGIIGIVASKLVSKYGVPSVTIGTETPSVFATEEPAYGSMRTIKGVNAINILNRCTEDYKKETGQELFLTFGGHAGAAGFKIDKEKIADFQRVYNEVTRKVVKSRRERMIYAGDIHEGEISLEEVKLFRQLLSPFGSYFEEPRFRVIANIKRWQVFGRDQQHIRGTLEKGTPFIFFFGNQAWVKRILTQKRVKLFVKLGINVYKSRESVNLIVEDIKSLKRKPKKLQT